MKMNAIDKKFSEIIAQYLANGWTINSKSMRGSQGEDCKVDLVKGDELVRVWMESIYNSSKYMWRECVLCLRVGTWNRPATDSTERNITVWMGDFNIFCEMVFYKIADNWYVDNLEEAQSIKKVQIDRLRKYNRTPLDTQIVHLISDDAMHTAIKFLKNKVGYKRISWYDIHVCKRVYSYGAKYVINYKGNSYTLK